MIHSAEWDKKRKALLRRLKGREVMTDLGHHYNKKGKRMHMVKYIKIIIPKSKIMYFNNGMKAFFEEDVISNRIISKKGRKDAYE